jgi:hypothetical protein
MRDLIPDGAMLVPDSITEAMDFDEKTRARTPSKDKVTVQRVWQCRVMDMDASLIGRWREVPVKILAEVRPVPTGAPFEPVEFTGRQVTPYVGSTGRLAFSIRETGFAAPNSTAKSSGRAT